MILLICCVNVKKNREKHDQFCLMRKKLKLNWDFKLIRYWKILLVFCWMIISSFSHLVCLCCPFGRMMKKGLCIRFYWLLWFFLVGKLLLYSERYDMIKKGGSIDQSKSIMPLKFGFTSPPHLPHHHHHHL